MMSFLILVRLEMYCGICAYINVAGMGIGLQPSSCIQCPERRRAAVTLLWARSLKWHTSVALLFTPQ